VNGYWNIKRRMMAGREPAVLLDFGEWRLTLREAVFSALIAGILAAAGFFISGAVERRVHERQLRYRQAVQIDKNPVEFRWALDTDIGYLFAEGTLETVDPVRHERLDGEWFSIEAAYQKYTRHTRTRTYTVSDGKGHTRVKSRVETYWSWDTYDVERSSAKTVRFLGVELPAGKFGPGWRRERRIVPIGHNRRIEFAVVPKKMAGTMFAKAAGGTVDGQIEFWRGRDLKSAYEDSVSSCAKGLFWTAWTAVIAGILFAFFYAENRWLEDNS